jgi:ligand-binding sensor domain-containing protein
MKLVLTILFSLLYFLGATQNKLGGIGQWRGHYDNHQIKRVIKGDYIYAASPYQIVKIEGNSIVNWIDKTTGLHDINIENITWDKEQQQLIISYANANIDILKNENIYNINALQLTNLYPDKKINDISIQKNIALVATNFGIVVLDLIKHEIKDTWFPNNTQQATITYGSLIAHDTVFAATENGIWACPFTNNTIQLNKWLPILPFDSLSIKHLTQKNNIIYGYTPHQLFQLPFQNPLFQINNGFIEHIDSTTTNLLISIQYPVQKGALLQLNQNKIINTLIDSSHLIAPMQAVFDNNAYWVADSTAGLLYKTNSEQWMNTGGIKGSLLGKMSINETTLLAPYGIRPGYTHFNASGWNNYQQIDKINLPNLYASLISPLDNTNWFTYRNSLVHTFNDDTKIEYIQPNAYIGDYKEMQLDYSNLIWALQDQQGIIRQTKNNWLTIPLPTQFNNQALDKFIVNNVQQAWILAPNKQGIYIYQSKDVFNAEMWIQLTTQPSKGNLPSNNVLSIVQDKLGSIWVGTDNGIGIFNCGDISNTPCNAYLPILTSNGFKGYLFQKEMVRCMAIDGANRKWIGTNNGAWLLSEDGLEIIEHFTTVNSPLPSDTLLQIIISPMSGEVFFNTTQQMVSYRGTATEGKNVQKDIKIFPNPIPPNFNGLVAIKELVAQAIVKITDITGKLIYETTALGGQAIWNARDLQGNKIDPGIYLVFIRDTSGNEKGIGKIVVATGY